MYVNSAFHTDTAAAWAFVRARGFGTVTAVDGGRRPVAAHVPLLIGPDAASPTLEFHVARVNPLHTVIAAHPQVLIVVWGPDAYVSPDWYVSADQVPTWNYTAAHLTGTAEALPHAAALDHVEALSFEFEGRLRPKKAWSTAKMTAHRREMMLRAIVPIKVTIETIEASSKLSQNKTEADRHEVSRMLSWRGSWNDQWMAEDMQRSLSEAGNAR